MASKNLVILIGNLGADVETRNLPSGAKVANFNIATSESWTNKNGEKVTETEWHRIEAWEGIAGVAEQYLKKGDPVYVEGKIKTEKWTDKEGNERYTTKIRATGLTLLGSAQRTSDGQRSNSGPENSQQRDNSTGQRAAAAWVREGRGMPKHESFEPDTDELPF